MLIEELFQASRDTAVDIQGVFFFYFGMFDMLII